MQLSFLYGKVALVLIKIYFNISAGHEKVIGNSVALVIGIPALIILVAIVLLKLKQSKTQDVQMQDLNFQNSGNDTAFVIGESRLEKRFVQLVRPASDFMAT